MKILSRVALSLFGLVLAASPIMATTAEAATWGGGGIIYNVYFNDSNSTQLDGWTDDKLTDGHCVYASAYFSGSWHTIPGSTSCGPYTEWLYTVNGKKDITAVRIYLSDNSRYETVYTGHTTTR